MNKKITHRTYIFRSSIFPNKGNFRHALTSIFGIGLTRAYYLCDVMGLGRHCKMENSNHYWFNLATFLVKNFYLTDLFLKKIYYDCSKLNVELNSYKGLRISFGLPLRGQRTKSNANTCKRLMRRPGDDKFSITSLKR